MSDASSTGNPANDPTSSTARTGGLPAWAVVLAWLVAVGSAWAGLGTFVVGAIEGMDSALVPKLPSLVTLLLIGVALVVTALWARGRSQSGAGASAEPAPARRRFLAGAAASAGGLVAVGATVFARMFGWATVTGPSIGVSTPLGAPQPRPQWAGARVRGYRRLGRTDFRVSDISLGSSKIRGELGERVAREAIERGVNYFDTAPDYSETGSEVALGRVMQGRRDKMFLATKFCTPQGHLPPGMPPSAYVEAVEASLKRLQTDYVDLVHIHSCDSLERLLDPSVHEAFETLKQQGKARFLGFSSHTPRLEEVANAAIEDGRFDVMMLAYHHGAWPSLSDIVRRAAAADIGVVAMKTLKGAKHQGLLESRDEADSYTQAAFKWVLADPSVSCLVISFRELANVDEYLYASGGTPSADDLALLEKYDRLIAGKHCYQHCGDCLGSCPAGVPIDDVLRHRMYFQDYGDQKEAMRLYSRLERNASICAGCPAPCATACPHGVPIPEYTREAHELLTLA